MDKNKIKQKIIELENNIEQLKSTIARTEKNLIALKELVWEREAKKESSKMFKVLEKQKPSTIVRSNVGDVIIDSELIQKEKDKHLDDPALRGMVTTQEFLSFPKVAKNVEAEYNKFHQNYTWKVKANDESVLRYGSREYVKDDKEINRLLTTYSETEKGKRKINQAGVGEQGQPHHLINDLNFLHPASETIPQDDKEINRLLTTHTKTERGERGHSHRQINDPDFHNSVGESIAQNNTNQQKPHNPTQAELQRKLTINLNNFERVSNKEQKQSFLTRANEISKQAQNLYIRLDSKSMQRLEHCNLTQNKLNTKER